jgi:hypothetical protein
MGRPKTKYTRAELIDICERARVLEIHWSDRDSESAQRQVGECWSLLRADCEFEVLYEPGESCSTDDQTIWVRTYSKGFNYFEGCGHGDSEEECRECMRKELHYLPTHKRIAEANGRDWY